MSRDLAASAPSAPSGRRPRIAQSLARPVAACLICAAAACTGYHPDRPVTTRRSPALHLLQVSHARPLGHVVILESWTRPVQGTRWSLVGAAGWIGDAEIVRVTGSGDCDHCPRYRAVARVGRLRGPITDSTFAIGPVTAPLMRGRVLSHDDQWWRTWDSAQKHGAWIVETAVDLDGDGHADLVRCATGPTVTFEVRRRIGDRWKATERWTEPYVLDARDTAGQAQQ